MRSFCERSSRLWKHRNKLTISPCCSLSLNSGVLRRPPDFSALALSCKRLKDLAEEALYTHNRDYGASLAVHWAAEHGNIATLDKAFRYGLDIHQDGPGLTLDSSPSSTLDSSPLYTAVMHGKDLAVAWFLDHGADVTLTGRARCDCPVFKSGFLHAALCLRHVSTAELLISRGAPLYYPSDGRQSAHWANALLEASFYGLDTIVEALVKDYGMDLQTRCSPSYHDALACAAMLDHNVSTIRTLVGLGADVNGSKNEWESSPLYVAIDEGNFSVANILLDLGAKILPYEHNVHIDPVIDGDDADSIQSQTVQVHVAPLHDTLGSLTRRRASRDWIHATSRFHKDVSKHWEAERTSFMKRLIQLGVDVNMEAWGSWVCDGFGHWFSPLDLAVDIGTIQDMEMLIASGAKVSHQMLHTAWKDFDKDLDGEGQKKAMLLLEHGARLDELIRDDRTLLQLAAHKSDHMEEESGFHELLLLSSPKSLSRDHLNEVLAECLTDLDWYPSTVLIHHGARVSCKDKLFSIASDIIQYLRFDGHEDDLQDLKQRSLLEDAEPTSRMGFILDMGLSSEDRCLIFGDVLQKRVLALVHLFLNRGVASRPDAAIFLPAYLMLAASWGNICVIKRLWQQLHEDLEPIRHFAIVQNSIIPGNREAVSFFMEHGASPFQCLEPPQVLEDARLAMDTALAEDAARARFESAAEDSSAALLARREYKKAQLHTARYILSCHDCTLLRPYVSPLDLAVQYGHMDIIRDLVERIKKLSASGSIITCRKIYIPCVLQKANEIQEMIQGAGLECEYR